MRSLNETDPTSVVYDPQLVGVETLDVSVGQTLPGRYLPTLGMNPLPAIRAGRTTTANLEHYSDQLFHSSSGSTSTIRPFPQHPTGPNLWNYPVILFEVRQVDFGASDPTAQARTEVAGFFDRTISVRATKVLDEMRRALIAADTQRLPPIHAFAAEDGSLLIEWISHDWRIGFSLEQDAKESSWYLVSSEAYGNVRACGALADIDLGWLVDWALKHLP